MEKKIIEVTCHCCQGVGEAVVEPGGDGYGPVYDTCWVCKGSGMVKTFRKNKKYFVEVN